MALDRVAGDRPLVRFDAEVAHRALDLIEPQVDRAQRVVIERVTVDERCEHGGDARGPRGAVAAHGAPCALLLARVEVHRRLERHRAVVDVVSEPRDRAKDLDILVDLRARVGPLIEMIDLRLVDKEAKCPDVGEQVVLVQRAGQIQHPLQVVPGVDADVPVLEIMHRQHATVQRAVDLHLTHQVELHRVGVPFLIRQPEHGRGVDALLDPELAGLALHATHVRLDTLQPLRIDRELERAELHRLAEPRVEVELRVLQRPRGDEVRARAGRVVFRVHVRFAARVMQRADTA